MKPAVKKIKLDPDEIGDARIRLRGALNDSIHLEDDYDAELPQRGRPSKRLLLAQQQTQRLLAALPEASTSKPVPDVPKRTKKYNTAAKKRATLSAQQKPNNESFVMKLFDRSLDLSKYTEQTPLYRICRAWMANQPRNTSITNFPKEEPEPVQRMDNAQEVLNKLYRREIRTITEMPLARKTDMSPIPTALIMKKEDQEQAAKLDGGTREQLLADHKKHWTKVRLHWNAHMQKYNEERHGIIFKILDKLNKT